MWVWFLVGEDYSDGPTGSCSESWNLPGSGCLYLRNGHGDTEEEAFVPFLLACLSLSGQPLPGAGLTPSPPSFLSSSRRARLPQVG